jgi:hypothetical protein
MYKIIRDGDKLIVKDTTGEHEDKEFDMNSHIVTTDSWGNKSGLSLATAEDVPILNALLSKGLID